MGFLVKVLVTTLAVVVGSYILPGVTVKDFTTAIVVAFVLGILNAVLKPILVILTIPVTILTLGLFLLIINALIIRQFCVLERVLLSCNCQHKRYNYYHEKNSFIHNVNYYFLF